MDIDHDPDAALGVPRPEVVGLAGLLLVGAAGRVIAPGYVLTLVPPWIPHPRAVVNVTGVAELVLAVALLRPAGRRRAAQLTAALIGAFLTSHLDAAARATPQRQRWLDRPSGVVVRLGVNAGYIAWAAHVARTARPR